MTDKKVQNHSERHNTMTQRPLPARPHSARFLRLMALLLTLPLLVLPVSSARGDAAADLLAKMSCDQVKKLAQDAPAQLFEMWAESGAFGANSALARDIVERGNIAGLLENIGDLTTLIQGLEEAASGDPKKVAEIFADWLLDKALTATGSGVPGAVWTVCKSLNDFAVALSSEILDINIKTFAGFAEKDPNLLGPNRVDYFLNNFLEMHKSSGGIFDPTYNLTKKRAAFLEYAREKLGQSDFPPPSEWDDPQNRKRVGAAALSMLRDVNTEVEKRKKFKQLQGDLKTQIEQLRREQAVFNTFESLRAQVNAMVCKDPSADCIAAYTATLNTLEGLILDAGDIQKTPTGTMNGLVSAIEAINLDLDALFQKMSQDKSKIDDFCANGKAAATAAEQERSQARITATEIAAQARVASGYRIKACEADTQTAARTAALKAREAAEKAAQKFSSLEAIGDVVKTQTPPEPADFAPMETKISDLDQALDSLDESIRKNLKKKESFLAAMAQANQQAADLDKKCQGAKDLGLVNQAMGRVGKAAGQIPDLRAEINTLASLRSKAGQVQARISRLRATEEKNRQCLSAIPDMSSLGKEIEALVQNAQTDVDQAQNHATAAEDCYQSMKSVCGPNEVRNADGECVCKSGYEKIDGECVKVQKKCGPNEVLDADGECVCKSGYEEIDGQCVKIQKKCGPNEVLNADDECVCKSGYEKIDGECVKIQKQCGPNEVLDADDECVCKSGYEKIDGECVKIQKQCGPNEVLDADGECVCKSGYEEIDGQCVKIQKKCGPNERLDADGMCVCRAGYKRDSKGNCTECQYDDECPLGYTCVRGKCVFQKADCRRDGCPSGYKCNTKTGECVFIKSGCSDDRECKQGYVCVDGKCVSPFDQDYDNFTSDMGDREDDRSQDQADRTAADQGGKGGRSGYTADDLTQDMDEVQDDISGGRPDDKKKCDPPCPAGYVCKNGACVEKPVCNCKKGQVCVDGKCVDQPVQQAALSITPANKAVVINETVNLKATFTDTDGSSKDVTAQASWSPSATFSKGTIGVYTVTASHKGLSATSQITVVKEKGMDDITVNQKTVTVTFWDHGQEDGDMIDILINGEVVFPGITLKNAHQSRTITMNADIIVVGFRALNEGRISPNTATVTFTSVTAGKPSQTYELKQNQEANMNMTYKP